MFYNRDEFVRVSGRVQTSRDGPGRALHEDERSPGAGAPWLLRSMAGAVRGMLEHPDRDAAVGSTHPVDGYSDRQSYLELEFAVGFGSDDEYWL